MDVIAENIAPTPPRAMLFAEDLALCEETKGETEQQLEVWRYAKESHGMRVSRQNTEYLAPVASESRLTRSYQLSPNSNTWARSSMREAVLRETVNTEYASLEKVERTHRSSVRQEGTTEAQTSTI